MATPTCLRRLNKEFEKLQDTENIIIRRSEDNILEWYFLFKNMDEPYAGGEYLGVLHFPKDYPYKAPTISFITPSGRFTPEVKICTTFSHFHPEEWSPEWRIETILIGLLSFMYEESPESIGGVSASAAERKKIAQESHGFNQRLAIYNKLFK